MLKFAYSNYVMAVVHGSVGTVVSVVMVKGFGDIGDDVEGVDGISDKGEGVGGIGDD